jgi:hypothetical protein
MSSQGTNQEHLYKETSDALLLHQRQHNTMGVLILARSESGIASALAWLGLAVMIATGSTLTILQAVNGIALKRAVDSWYAAPHATGEDKAHRVSSCGRD